MEQTKKSGNTRETLPTNTQCWNVVQKVDEKRHAFENKKNSKKKSTRGEGFGQREARGSLGQSGPERVQTRTSETPFLKIAFCRFYFSFGSKASHLLKKSATMPYHLGTIEGGLTN